MGSPLFQRPSCSVFCLTWCWLKKRALNLEFYFNLRLLTLIIQWFLFVKSLFLAGIKIGEVYTVSISCIIKLFFFFFLRKSYQLKGQFSCKLSYFRALYSCFSFTTQRLWVRVVRQNFLFFSCFIKIKRFLIKANKFSAVVIFLQMLPCIQVLT